MILHVDESWILEVAERVGHRDPAADDYGVPIAAAARHRGELLDTPVYDGAYARAAVLVHTLGRCRWLVPHQATFALVGLGQVRIGVGMSRWQVGQAPVQVTRSVRSSRTTW